MHTLPGGGAAEEHTHAGTDIDSGTIDVGRLPTGTTGTTVALGDHTHVGSDAAITLTGSVQAFHGSPRVYDRGNGWVTMDGGIEATGTNNAGTTLVTIPAGYRPATAKNFTIRHTDTSASTGTITVGTDGTVTYNSGFSGSAEMDFSGIEWRKA